MRRFPVRRVLALAALFAAVPAAAHAAPSITTYSVNMPVSARPLDIAANPADGTLWFTDDGTGTVGQISTGGAITVGSLSGSPNPQSIAAGPNGTMWLTDQAQDDHRIVRIAADGTRTPFTDFQRNSGPHGIALGPDGALWFTERDANAIGRLDPATGAITELTGALASSANPEAITAGPDGNLWFIEQHGGRIGRLTPQWTLTEFNTPSASSDLSDIAAGPDGNVWFTEHDKDRIGRITPQGVVTEFPATGGGHPVGITASTDGNLYFTIDSGASVGRITPSGTISLIGGLPSSNAGAGITTGPDGNVWLALRNTRAIARLTVAPGAGSITAAGITSAAATLSASLATSSQDTTYSFEYGTTTGYGSATATATQAAAAGAQSVSAPLTGLQPNTTYHTRLVATNGSGTTYGPDRSFTTTLLGAPSATTGSASGVNASGATLQAVVNPEASATTYRFDWGTDTGYGQSAPSPAASLTVNSNDQAVSLPLTGLPPNTTYHFRVVATSASGTTAGADQAFTTSAIAPSAATGGASGVTGTTATVDGSLNPRNAGASYRFEYGTTTAYGNATPSPDAALGAYDNAAHAVSETLNALEPNTTYHFRLVATGNAGSTAGADQTFTTPAVGPDATTAPATGVTAADATLAATVNAHNSATTYRFEWGATTAYGTTTSAQTASDGADHAAGETLSGLEPNTTYHFRVVATSPAGTTVGADESFTTAKLAPDATTSPALAVTSDGAELRGAVNAHKNATAYRFEWGTTTAYGTTTAPGTASSNASQTVTEALTALEPNTTYHFRVIATSDAGTSTGADQAFTTAAPAPDATTDVATGVTSDGARLNGTVNARNSTTSYRFEWGATTTYGTTTSAHTASDNANHALTEALAALEPNTTYHFRVVASSPAGGRTGADRSFTTAAMAPEAATGDATGVSDTGATLAARVGARKSATTYHFEWGTTTDYGSASPERDAGDALAGRDVELALGDLVPGTTYHFRIVATNAAGAQAGDDHTLTTAPPGGTADAPAAGAAPRPELGRSVVGDAARGSVRVQAAGATGFVPVDDAAAIPTGSTIDTRGGAITLVSALPGGKTQKATFWGGVFTIRQRAKDGMTDLELRGTPAGCPRRSLDSPFRFGFHGTAVAAAKKKKRVLPHLWGSDSHGSYRTHGRNSAATVRGTRWLTTETCAGTRTTVSSGAVSVFDKRTHRAVVVKAGDSYLARPTR